jgi:5-formaminoimidazole-4-carboxamide-1-beta-D-ribofuranosyl 5'-monophosphate synthetase
MMIKIRKGSRLFYTTIGYKGFHYPSADNSYLLTEEAEARPLTWIVEEGETRIPVAIHLPDDPARVVWVNKKDIVK